MKTQRFDELTDLLTGEARAPERTALQPAKWAELLTEYHQLKQVKTLKPADRQIESAAGHQKARRYLFHNSD